jgi:hypothetical protein
VPANIVDLVEKIKDKNIRDSERNNYIVRLETTASYINESLSKNKMNQQQPMRKNQNR